MFATPLGSNSNFSYVHPIYEIQDEAQLKCKECFEKIKADLLQEAEKVFIRKTTTFSDKEASLQAISLINEKMHKEVCRLVDEFGTDSVRMNMIQGIWYQNFADHFYTPHGIQAEIKQILLKDKV